MRRTTRSTTSPDPSPTPNPSTKKITYYKASEGHKGIMNGLGVLYIEQEHIVNKKVWDYIDQYFYWEQVQPLLNPKKFKITKERDPLNTKFLLHMKLRDPVQTQNQARYSSGDIRLYSIRKYPLINCKEDGMFAERHYNMDDVISIYMGERRHTKRMRVYITSI